ncbi:MAG TPA: carbohydrate porin [Caulobacteraceae bacterium]|jgi:high affinity Mn2+ porin|nr:carbohydrate porin [Caulobacteraceae bacterium]
MTHARMPATRTGRRGNTGLLGMAVAAGTALICAAPGVFADPLQTSNVPVVEPISNTAAPTPEGTPEPETAPSEQTWAFHAQSTFVYQGHPAFRSPYQGANSLDAVANARETWDLTAYAGWRPWAGGELWINPEIDQGFGLDNTLGVAGFPSAEAYKVGRTHPYVLVHRFFFRQTLDLRGKSEGVSADENVLAKSETDNRLVWTVGKFSVVDVFDTNKYAHDPRQDFLNWSIVDTGSFDYAADSWGYTAGSALEWYQGRFAFRGGAFLLSDIPNDVHIDTRFKQFELIGEVEERHQILGHPGAVRVTFFLNRGYMGRYDQAIELGLETGLPPSTADVRHYASRAGWAMNLEQELTRDLGAFARVGFSDGHYETFDFTDIDKTVAAGLSLAGRSWNRPNDTVGLAGVVNGASNPLLEYLNAGGLGVLVGDGKLPNPGWEQILETYYSFDVIKQFKVSLDYQLVGNPGYNRDRGPANIFAIRLHTEF